MAVSLPRTGAVLGVILILATSCTGGSSDDSQGAAPAGQVSASPTQSTEDPFACRDACGAHDKEVKTTPCSTPADDVVKPQKTATDPVEGNRALLPTGSLSLRRSLANGGDCDRLFWARFEPDPTNQKAFQVGLQVSDPKQDAQASFTRVQKSEPQRPDWAAFTVGIKVRVGFRVSACILRPEPDENQLCVSTIVV